MSVLKSKTNDGQIQVRFKVEGKTVCIKARAWSQILKEINKYKPLYL
jgi:hypothetical protein